jgi:hypothetical protein
MVFIDFYSEVKMKLNFKKDKFGIYSEELDGWFVDSEWKGIADDRPDLFRCFYIGKEPAMRSWLQSYFCINYPLSVFYPSGKLDSENYVSFGGVAEQGIVFPDNRRVWYSDFLVSRGWKRYDHKSFLEADVLRGYYPIWLEKNK